MKNYKAEITNKTRYKEAVVDVDLTGIKEVRRVASRPIFYGHIAVETTYAGTIFWSGEHGEDDFRKVFGFRIVEDETPAN